jgi:hypothetical protein
MKTPAWQHYFTFWWGGGEERKENKEIKKMGGGSNSCIFCEMCVSFYDLILCGAGGAACEGAYFQQLVPL